MPLTSNLSVHVCPLTSDSKAARVQRPRYSRVNIHVYTSVIRVTHVCARVTSARSASIPRPLPPRKKVEGLGTRLACPLRVNLVQAFERERVRFRVFACTHASTHVCVCKYSRATREGYQVTRERHCTHYMYNDSDVQLVKSGSNSMTKAVSVGLSDSPSGIGR